MSFDVLARGAHIWITHKEFGNTRHWWFDWEHKRFWPEQIPVKQDPTAIHAFASSTANKSAVIMGCRDGYLRKMDDLAHDDDGEVLLSHVIYGPLRAGGPGQNAILTKIDGTLAEDSGDVDWSIITGATAEDAVEGVKGLVLLEGTGGAVTGGILDESGVTWDAHGITTSGHICIIETAGDGGGTLIGVYPISTIHSTNGLTLTGVTSGSTRLTWRVEKAPSARGTWNVAGLNYPARPRVRGAAFVVKVEGARDGRGSWSMERLSVDFKRGGKTRKA